MLDLVDDLTYLDGGLSVREDFLLEMLMAYPGAWYTLRSLWDPGESEKYYQRAS